MHPAPPSSTQLHPSPTNSFQTPPSSSQHPQQYFNQNIARNLAISPNLGRKIKSCLFWLKISTHGILEVFIPNPDLDFWANFGPKIQSCLFCLKIGAHIIARMLIPNQDLDFWNFDSKSNFRQIWAQQFKVEKLVYRVPHGYWFLFQH